MHKKNFCVNCGMCKMPCNHEECKAFDRCIHACANGAFSVSGYEISADELAEKLKKNEELLKSLGGGITISGGEPMLQADFVCELADKIKNIHMSIQTSGYTDEETYKRVIDKFDYIMQDIKLVDCEAHKLYTGVSNEKILKNIEYLKHGGKEFIFRVPMIPNITDTEENLAAIAKLTEGYNVEYIPYNTLAGAKYEMLGMEYKLEKKGNSYAE